MQTRKSIQEQRISPRKSLKTRVVFEDEFNEEFLYFLSTDISLSGIFIESSILLRERTKLFLKFSLYEGDDPIQVTGEVARIMAVRRGRGRRKKNQKIGVGIRFIGLKAEDLRKIEEFVSA